MPKNVAELLNYGKALAGLTPELEAHLQIIAPKLLPHLPRVTDTFYARLIALPAAAVFLDSHNVRLDTLKENHTRWLNGLFTQAIDADFAQRMTKVGDIHVGIQLPLNFMTGAMSLINKELIDVISTEFASSPNDCAKALKAVIAVTSLALIIMQQSYELW